MDEVDEVDEVDEMVGEEGGSHFFSHNDQKVWKIKWEEAKDKLELD